MGSAPPEDLYNRAIAMPDRGLLQHTGLARGLTVVVLILLAALPRFYGLWDRGIFDYDEAWFLLEAKSLHDAGIYGWSRWTGQEVGADSIAAFLKARGTVPVTSAKPGHTVLVLLGLLLFGIHDYSSFLVSALLGTATVYLIYRFAARAFGWWPGMLAGLVLALSPFHVGYSRSGYTQAAGLFFVAIAMCLWQRQAERRPRPLGILFLSGVAVGYAFTCHFNLFMIPVLFLLGEAFCCLRRDAGRPCLRTTLLRLFLLGSGMLLPLLAFDLPVRALRYAGVFPQDQLPYLQQLLPRVSGGPSLSFGMLPAIWAKFTSSEGTAVLAIVVIGTVVALATRGHKSRTAGLVSPFFLVQAVLWCVLSVWTTPIFRNFAVLALPAAVLAGVGLQTVVEWITRIGATARRATYGLVCLLVLANAFWRLGDLVEYRSTYRQATQEWLTYVAEHRGRIAFLPRSAWPIWYFYLSSQQDRLHPGVRECVTFYPADKREAPPVGDYDAADVKRYFRSTFLGQRELGDYLARLDASCDPVVSIHNPAAELPMAYFETGGEATRKTLDCLSQISGSRYIRIYDLRRCRPPGGIPEKG